MMSAEEVDMKINGTELRILEIDLSVCDQLILDKGALIIQWLEL